MAEEPDPPEDELETPGEEEPIPEEPVADAEEEGEEAGTEVEAVYEEEVVYEEEATGEEEPAPETASAPVAAEGSAEEGALLQPCTNCATLLDVGDLEPFAKVHCPICGTAIRARTQLKNFTLV